MDYEKKYKEALERARNYYKGHILDVNPQSAMEFIFPELKESEDERIREELIHFLVGKRIISNDLEGVDIDKTLSWLEKQGEKSWSGEDERIYQSIIDDTVQENQLDDKKINWLKSLKDRVQPQPKQDWSEDILIEGIKQVGLTQRQIDWLKSLKPCWKPTEEQMEAL